MKDRAAYDKAMTETRKTRPCRRETGDAGSMGECWRCGAKAGDDKACKP